jgi:hypothetical protein
MFAIRREKMEEQIALKLERVPLEMDFGQKKHSNTPDTMFGLVHTRCCQKYKP